MLLPKAVGGTRATALHGLTHKERQGDAAVAEEPARARTPTRLSWRHSRNFPSRAGCD